MRSQIPDLDLRYSQAWWLLSADDDGGGGDDDGGGGRDTSGGGGGGGGDDDGGAGSGIGGAGAGGGAGGGGDDGGPADGGAKTDDGGGTDTGPAGPDTGGSDTGPAPAGGGPTDNGPPGGTDPGPAPAGPDGGSDTGPAPAPVGGTSGQGPAGSAEASGVGVGGVADVESVLAGDSTVGQALNDAPADPSNINQDQTQGGLAGAPTGTVSTEKIIAPGGEDGPAPNPAVDDPNSDYNRGLIAPGTPGGDQLRELNVAAGVSPGQFPEASPTIGPEQFGFDPNRAPFPDPGSPDTGLPQAARNATLGGDPNALTAERLATGYSSAPGTLVGDQTAFGTGQLGAAQGQGGNNTTIVAGTGQVNTFGDQLKRDIVTGNATQGGNIVGPAGGASAASMVDLNAQPSNFPGAPGGAPAADQTLPALVAEPGKVIDQGPGPSPAGPEPAGPGTPGPGPDGAADGLGLTSTGGSGAPLLASSLVAPIPQPSEIAAPTTPSPPPALPPEPPIVPTDFLNGGNFNPEAGIYGNPSMQLTPEQQAAQAAAAMVGLPADGFTSPLGSFNTGPGGLGTVDPLTAAALNNATDTGTGTV